MGLGNDGDKKKKIVTIITKKGVENEEEGEGEEIGKNNER